MHEGAKQLLIRLRRKAKKGARGYPVGTLAFYGPDDRRATKAVAAIVEQEGAEPSRVEKWQRDDGDVRSDARVLEAILAFFSMNGPRSIVMPDRIVGCPHEEGIDYERTTCPKCPFWANRDRWTGDLIH